MNIHECVSVCARVRVGLCISHTQQIRPWPKIKSPRHLRHTWAGQI